MAPPPAKRMSAGDILLIAAAVLALAALAADRLFASKLHEEFKQLEKKHIVVSNKLATAKIIDENLNHVRELIYKNIDFPGHEDSIPHQSRFLSFVTTCMNDLKLKLISFAPGKQSAKGSLTTIPYTIEFEGDFFSFGELCAKFENSRRVISVETFDVSAAGPQAGGSGSGRGQTIKVKMNVSTYRLRKQ
jgi:Tfp pilus assembly protein PilO